MKPLMILLVASAAVSATAQDRFADVQVTTHAVRGPVHMLVGAGGNVGVLSGEDGVLIIDDQYAPMAPKLRTALEAIQPGAPKFVINTHFHGDHTGGNPEFGADAYIIGHDNVRSRLATNSRNPREALPTITYSDSASVHFNDEELKLIHFPAGHTDTDTIIFFTKANVIHTGDHFFNGKFPFIDLGSGGSVDGYIANVAKVISMIDDDTKIIPGHGPLATKADYQAFHDALTECRDIVKKRMDEGKDSKAVREEGLPAKFDSWGDGFVSGDRWIATLYRGLGGE